MNLTKREKLLLGVLGLLLLISLYVVFLFLPLFEGYNTNSTELKNQEELHESMEETAKRFGTNDKALQDAKKSADKKLEGMLPTQENDKLHDYLLYIAEGAGMKVMKTELLESSIQVVSPEINIEVAVEGENVQESSTLQDNLFSVNGIENMPTIDPQINEVYLEKNVISLSVEGNQEQLAAFLEAIINENKTMKTTGLDYSTEDGYYTVTISMYSTKGME